MLARCLLSVALGTMALPLAAMTSAELDTAWLGLQNPQPGLDTRFTYAILLEAVAANWHPERWTSLLATCQADMDLNPADAQYGNCGIGYGQAPTDPNVGVFCMQSCVILLAKYSAALTSAERTTLTTLMTAGLSHVEGYSVNPDYTNMYLLKAACLITMGESLPDSTAATTGYAMLPNFLSYTAQNGIHEFCSPTYYGVDLEALGTILALSSNATARGQAQTIANLVWTDIAACWYAPAERIGGTHARDHDYIHGWGKCDVDLACAGWLVHRTPTIAEAFPAADSTFMQVVHTTPPAWAGALSTTIPRTIAGEWQMQFQNLPWQQRFVMVGNHVQLACSGGSYCQEDKLLDIQVPGSDDSIANICYVLDGLGAPYGTDPTANGLGNASLQHFQPLVVAQQAGADAVEIIDESLASTAANYSQWSGVHSDFLLPASASIWSGESPVAMPAANASTTLSSAQPIFIQVQDCVVALRLLWASDVHGNPCVVSLVNDGGSLQACRILIEHAAVIPSNGFQALAAMHVRVAEGLTTTGFGAFRAAFEAAADAVSMNSGVLDARADTGSAQLEVAVNTSTNQPVTYPANTSQVLAINGVDVGAQILQGQSPTFSGINSLSGTTGSGTTTGGSTTGSSTTTGAGTTTGSTTGAGTTTGSTTGAGTTTGSTTGAGTTTGSTTGAGTTGSTTTGAGTTTTAATTSGTSTSGQTSTQSNQSGSTIVEPASSSGGGGCGIGSGIGMAAILAAGRIRQLKRRERHGRRTRRL